MSEKFQLPSHESSSHGYDDVMRRLVRTPLAAGLAAAAIACSPAKKESVSVEKPPAGAGIVKWIEGNEDDFLKKYERGEFTPEERAQRTKTLPNGEIIFEDVGLTFYKVQKGDTISGVRTALAKYPQFAYLKDQKLKLQSFNIPPREFKAGMWIPIPLKNTDRHLTDEQFVEFATNAIRKLEDDATYGDAVKKILDCSGMTEKKLVASMLAVAKQESGGQPLGCFELHRWEGNGSHNEFSFSMFHVLMMGPGLKARRNLDMTEGQTYHPENAVKLFIGFLVEKGKESNKDIAQFFPFTEESLKKFATFYNGKGWMYNNRSYPKNVLKFYKEGLEIVD